MAPWLVPASRPLALGMPPRPSSSQSHPSDPQVPPQLGFWPYGPPSSPAWQRGPPSRPNSWGKNAPKYTPLLASQCWWLGRHAGCHAAPPHGRREGQDGRLRVPRATTLQGFLGPRGARSPFSAAQATHRPPATDKGERGPRSARPTPSSLSVSAETPPHAAPHRVAGCPGAG